MIVQMVRINHADMKSIPGEAGSECARNAFLAPQSQAETADTPLKNLACFTAFFQNI